MVSVGTTTAPNGAQEASFLISLLSPNIAAGINNGPFTGPLWSINSQLQPKLFQS